MTSVSARLGRLLSRCAVWSFRRPLLVLLAATVLLSGFGFAVTRLELDPDIAELLPPHYQSVRDVDELRERFGGVGYVVVLLEGGERDERLERAHRLAARAEELETVAYVQLERPAAYLRKKALWLFEYADLVELEKRLERRYHYEIDRSFLDLDDQPPPPVEVDDLVGKLEHKFLGSSAGGSSAGGSSAGGSSEHATAVSRYYEDEGRLAVFIRPRKLATDIDFSRRVVGDVETVVDELSRERTDSDVSFQLTGRYKKRVDLQGVLRADLGLTATLALSLVAGYLALHFRRVTAVVLLLVPLVAGLVIAYGFASMTFGTLNILTAFLGAILIGIGIDSGIHLLGRVHERTAGGASTQEAVAVAFRDAGRVSVAASLTTAAAFVSLAATDFRAFREFGLLTSGGILFVLASYLLLMPALLRGASASRWFGSTSSSLVLRGSGALIRWRKLLIIFLGVPVLVLCALAPRAHFDADLSRLDDADLPSFHLDEEVTRMLGRSQTPLVAFASDAEQARQAAQAVRRQMAEAGDRATIGEVATIAEVLPSDVERKRPHVANVQKMLSRVAQGELRDQLERGLPEFDELLQAGPPKESELPESIRRVLAPDSSLQGGPLVLLYPSVSLGDPEAMQRLSDQVREIVLPSGAIVRSAGEPMVVADILALIRRDGPRILLLTVVLVFTLLRLTLGRFRLALLATLPALLTVLTTAGLAWCFDVSFNVLNVIILPILVGIGVDDGAHFVARLDEGTPLEKVWKHTGADVTGAIVTTAFGFGVLSLASHPGLRGLGHMALLGLGANFVICVLLLPAILSAVPLFPTHRLQSSSSV